MLARFGNVLYWLCCGLTPIPLAAAGWQIYEASKPTAGMFDDLIPKPGMGVLLFGLVIAAGVWLCGRAARYILAGT